MLIPLGLTILYFLSGIKDSPRYPSVPLPAQKDGMQTWRGQIVSSDLKPVQGVIIDINDGISKDTSDVNGHFELSLAKSYLNQQVDLALYYHGKLNTSHKIRLSAEVLETLKIEPAAK